VDHNSERGGDARVFASEYQKEKPTTGDAALAVGMFFGDAP
jgi:hypothetical protein